MCLCVCVCVCACVSARMTHAQTGAHEFVESERERESSRWLIFTKICEKVMPFVDTSRLQFLISYSQ